MTFDVVIRRAGHQMLRWFDADALADVPTNESARRINWLRCMPFIAIHLGCLGVFWVGSSVTAVAICLGLFWLRMFAITAFYHRYFSHRSFKTNRGWQLVFAILGNSAAQRGPLWWASHHRQHHRCSDRAGDIHSPHENGFWWSHVGWFMSDAGFRTDYGRIRDFAKFPELRFLNRFDSLVPVSLGLLLYLFGEGLNQRLPELGVTGWQLVVWGFCISTVLLFHSTFTINSLCHSWGHRRFATRDQSRNNLWLALLTLGEGWHNNHHRFAVSARQGFYWWQIDISFYLLKLLSWLGVVRELNPVPRHVLREGEGNEPH